MYTGPNVEIDGLVFGYDTGYGVADNSTATRHYPGKPTSNSLETDANWTYIGTNLTSPDDLPVSLPKGVKFHIASKNSSISWNDACRNYTDSYAAGTNITVSGWHMFYSTDTSMTMSSRSRLGWHYSKDGASTYGGTIYTATEWNKWYYFSHTFSSTGVTTNLRVEDGGYDYYLDAADAAKTTQYYCNLQIEVGTNIPSPYTLGTRSSTQSLIDLKRTTDIDVSNISFNSDGQPTFDGSNDQLVVDVDDIVRTASSITIEGMVNATSISSAGPWGILTDHATTSDKDGFWWHYNINNSVYFRVEDSTAGEQGTTFSGTVPFVANTYQHIVTVVGDNNVKIYVNGVLSKSYTPNFKWNRIDSSKTAYLHIGRTYPNYYLSCAIPVFKMYNRELSVDEIKQNFNAYKNRFNI